MLGWVMMGVLLGAAGVGVLALLTLRLYRQVRQLGRDVSAAGARISALSDQLQPPAPRRPRA